MNINIIIVAHRMANESGNKTYLAESAFQKKGWS